MQTQMAFLSGKTGLQLGSAVVLDSTETANQLLHLSAAGSHYVLLQRGRHQNDLPRYKKPYKILPNTPILHVMKLERNTWTVFLLDSWCICFLPESGVYGLALWRIAAKAKPGMEERLRKDQQWEENAGTTGLVPVYE